MQLSGKTLKAKNPSTFLAVTQNPLRQLTGSSLFEWLADHLKPLPRPHGNESLSTIAQHATQRKTSRRTQSLSVGLFLPHSTFNCRLLCCRTCGGLSNT